jgi:hypothetical protein
VSCTEKIRPFITKLDTTCQVRKLKSRFMAGPQW